MIQENDGVYFFTIKYDDGNLICDAEWDDLNSPGRQEVDKRMALANKILGVIHSHYPNATNIHMEVTSDDSKNVVGFVSDDIPLNVIWRKWESEYYLVYLSQVDKATGKFIEQYPANNPPEIPGYPYVTAVPIKILEVLDDIIKTANDVWHRLTDAD